MPYVWHDSFVCMTWSIHMCDMIHSCVWHNDIAIWCDAIRVTWLILYVWHDSFVCMTWSIHMCDLIHSCVWHNSIAIWCDAFFDGGRILLRSRHIYEWVMSQIRMSHVTDTNESCHTYEWVMWHIRMSHVTDTNESCHTYGIASRRDAVMYMYVWHIDMSSDFDAMPHARTSMCLILQVCAHRKPLCTR